MQNLEHRELVYSLFLQKGVSHLNNISYKIMKEQDQNKEYLLTNDSNAIFYIRTLESFLGFYKLTSKVKGLKRLTTAEKTLLPEEKVSFIKTHQTIKLGCLKKKDYNLIFLLLWSTGLNREKTVIPLALDQNVNLSIIDWNTDPEELDRHIKYALSKTS